MAHPLVDRERLRGRHPLHQRSYLDVKLRLADHLLGEHGDRMVMAHSVEGRYPFLDPEIIELARRMPPDLTKYTVRNGGVFPSEKVRRIIDGRDVMAHGDRTMPVWGSVFSRQRGADDASVTVRIDALVAFLQSIQERAAE